MRTRHPRPWSPLQWSRCLSNSVAVMGVVDYNDDIDDDDADDDADDNDANDDHENTWK